MEYVSPLLHEKNECHRCGDQTIVGSLSSVDHTGKQTTAIKVDASTHIALNTNSTRLLTSNYLTLHFKFDHKAAKLPSAFYAEHKQEHNR